ncbi:U3 snoRNP protein [Tulasnella sp. 330]|nr:U3 snoRNP protein [Tulasnella sp. 330]
MDYVQLNQEDMVAELKDLRHKKIFTKEEIKRIVVRRTAFESTLVRRHPKKGDYLRYVEYLMALEALRKKRVNRLKLHAAKESLADYCLVRAQHHTFERATRRFKDDVGLWVQYFNLAKREKSNSLAGSIAARALQLHPTSIPLYIISASHQMSLGGTEAARTLLQRGIRLNPESIQLWTEYAKMEMEFVQQTKRELRKLKKQQKDLMEIDEVDAEELVPDVRADVDLRPEVKDIVDGAIVKSVVRHAVEARPTIELFASLRKAMLSYPPSVRNSLLEDLFSHLKRILPHEPQAIKLHATHILDEDEAWVETPDFVDQLRQANDVLVDGVKYENVNREEMSKIYVKWVETWVAKLQDVNLRLYLIRSLQHLVSSLPPTHLSPSLAVGDIKLGKSDNIVKSRAKIFKYLEIFPSSTDMWLACLALSEEDEEGETSDRLALWREAMTKSRGATEDLVRIWSWGPYSTLKEKRRRQLWNEILTTSIQHPSADLHSHIIIERMNALYASEPPFSASERHSEISNTITSNLPSAACYELIFEREASLLATTTPTTPTKAAFERSSKLILELVSERWRKVPGQSIDASVCYASLLIKAGDGKGAKDMIDRTRTMLDGEEREILDRRWTDVLNGRLRVLDVVNTKKMPKSEALSRDQSTSESSQATSHIAQGLGQGP